MRILVVEDEEAIADFVVRGLAAEGYAVEHARDGIAARSAAVGDDVDLVVLDVLLPKLGGLEVLAEIRRAKPALPVIVLSARGSLDDKLAGLDRGATDYMTKPFAFEELLARVRTHLRGAQQVASATLEVAGIRADLLTRRVEREGVPIELSAREFELLIYFMRRPGQVLSRERLLNGVWGYDFDPGTNVVGVYVGYLRRKLTLPNRPAPLETVRSAGYRLREDA